MCLPVPVCCGWTSKFRMLKFAFYTLETSLIVYSAERVSIFEPFRCDSQVWRTDRQTDKQTDKLAHIICRASLRCAAKNPPTFNIFKSLPTNLAQYQHFWGTANNYSLLFCKIIRSQNGEPAKVFLWQPQHKLAHRIWRDDFWVQHKH